MNSRTLQLWAIAIVGLVSIVLPGAAYAQGTFSPTGNLGTARYFHSATLLPNGSVLTAGGANSAGAPLSSAERYDPARGTFNATGSIIASARYAHTATLLPNGKVLVAGGANDVLSSPIAAFLYDTVTGVFTPTGSLGQTRFAHTATLLPNGKVLIVGGESGGYRASAELYDPASGTFTPTGNLTFARAYHTATLLPNGKVLIAGGYGGTFLASAELYDPATGTFTATGSLPSARYGHSATLLPNGKVLIAGGYNGTAYLTSAALYEPATATFTPTGSLVTARHFQTATLLPNGKVLVAGGLNAAYLTSAELYDPATGSFSTTGSLGKARYGHTATLLPSGRVLVVGGFNTVDNYLNSAELYDTSTGTFGATGSLASTGTSETATLLPNGRVLVAGGFTGSGFLNRAELYDAAAGSYSATGSLVTARDSHTATLLFDGRALIVGGRNSSGTQASAELYDPGTGNFSATGSLGSARASHTATLLANGKVLIVGGAGGSGYLTSAELYDPVTRTFSPTGSLFFARQYHTATLLPNGKVLIVGGWNGVRAESLIELYDPATGSFSLTVGLLTARDSHTATLLPNGKVLIAGGFDGEGAYLASAELYDPAIGTFTAAGSLGVARAYHTATLLPNGDVLIAGGPGPISSAERYDPAKATFSATGSLVAGRSFHTATLLPNGRVLIAGGSRNPSELYDTGLGFADIRRPRITSAPASLGLPGTLTLQGSGFFGDSEASSGGMTSSPTNYPVVQLQRLDNEQTFWVAPTSPFTSSSWSGALTVLPGGWYSATLLTNGIPSTQQLIAIATAPTVVTGTATNVTKTSAALNGTIIPNGISTAASFQYGPTAAYGSSVPATPAPGSGTSPVAVSAAIAGLTCNAEYHFRSVGTNATVTNGGDGTFRAAACTPPMVVTSSATDITGTSATLNASVNPNGIGSSLIFEYGIGNYGSVAVVGSVGSGTGILLRSFALAGLTCGTTYQYRAVATNTDGTTVGGGVTFTTTACPVPIAVTLPAASITTSTVTLNATVNPNGSSTTVSFDYGLTISYGASVAATPSPVSGSSPVAVSATVSGLSCNTQYHYRVRATNANGTGLGGDGSFTTAPCAPTVATQPATNLTATGATLNASVNPNGASTTLDFEYGIGGFDNLAVYGSVGSGTTLVSASFPLSGLSCGTLYRYRARATGAAGPTLGAELTFTTLACPPPTVVTLPATNITTSGATLNGTVNPNGTSTTTLFEYGPTAAYGASVPATPAAGSGVVPVTVSGAISGLACNTLYHFRAVGTGASTVNGLDLTFTTAACLPVVTSSATDITETSATLNADVNPNGAILSLFFEYGIGTNDRIAIYGTVSGTTTVRASRTVTGLSCATTYQYRAFVEGNGILILPKGENQFFTTRPCPGGPFTDDVLTVGVSPIRAVHMTELRDRINGLRTRFKLAPFAWTNASLVAGMTMSVLHVTELRTALQAAYAAAGRPAVTFSDPIPTPGSTVIRLVHIQELRDAVRALEKN